MSMAAAAIRPDSRSATTAPRSATTATSSAPAPAPRQGPVRRDGDEDPARRAAVEPAHDGVPSRAPQDEAGQVELVLGRQRHRPADQLHGLGLVQRRQRRRRAARSSARRPGGRRRAARARARRRARAAPSRWRRWRRPRARPRCRPGRRRRHVGRRVRRRRRPGRRRPDPVGVLLHVHADPAHHAVRTGVAAQGLRHGRQRVGHVVGARAAVVRQAARLGHRLRPRIVEPDAQGVEREADRAGEAGVEVEVRDVVDADARARQGRRRGRRHGGGAPQLGVAGHVGRVLGVAPAAQVDAPLLGHAQRVGLGRARQHHGRPPCRRP